MPNPNTFDEASAATEEMFANEQLSFGDAPASDEGNNTETAPEAANESGATVPEAADPNTVPEGNDPVPAAGSDATPEGNQTATAPETAIEQAAATAEVAAQVASEKNDELTQARAELETLRQQNAQLQGTIDEMSRQNAESVAEEALMPPTIDINGLAFADEETQRAATKKFSDDMAAYTREQLMKELAPTLEYAKKGMLEAQRAEVIDALSKLPELNGIGDMVPQLDRIIAANKWLQSEDMPLDEKYITAFAMARGINAINTPPAEPVPPKEPTPEEMLAMYNSNPAFQELVEKQRIGTIKQSQQVPPFSASSGAVNAALNIKEKPKTLEEASERTRVMFGEM